MATARNFDDRGSETQERDFYLPAASVSSALDSVGSFLTRSFGGHGVVLIPDTYNK